MGTGRVARTAAPPGPSGLRETPGPEGRGPERIAREAVSTDRSQNEWDGLVTRPSSRLGAAGS